MTVNPKTKPPFMCPGKKNPWIPASRTEMPQQVPPGKPAVEG